MDGKEMGALLARLRKERNMTQRELAEKLNITDKAVSKWERGLSCPDLTTLPALAEILDLSVEDLVRASAPRPTADTSAGKLTGIILKAVPLALGVALLVTSLLGGLGIRSGFGMAGLALACLALDRFREIRS